MVKCQRFWAGSLHSIEPDRLLNGVYVREQVVFAKDYDTLAADLAEAREIIRLTRTDDVMAGRECSFHREIDAFLYRTEGM